MYKREVLKTSIQKSFQCPSHNVLTVFMARLIYWNTYWKYSETKWIINAISLLWQIILWYEWNKWITKNKQRTYFFVINKITRDIQFIQNHFWMINLFSFGIYIWNYFVYHIFIRIICSLVGWLEALSHVL